VTRAPLSDADAAARLDVTLREWAALWNASSFVGHIEHQPLPDDKGHFHWLVRLKGDEKDVITLWLSLRQRTVFAETELMPAPEEQLDELVGATVHYVDEMYPTGMTMGLPSMYRRRKPR
jgi:hypothetical protein